MHGLDHVMPCALDAKRPEWAARTHQRMRRLASLCFKAAMNRAGVARPSPHQRLIARLSMAQVARRGRVGAQFLGAEARGEGQETDPPEHTHVGATPRPCGRACNRLQ